ELQGHLCYVRFDLLVLPALGQIEHESRVAAMADHESARRIAEDRTEKPEQFLGDRLEIQNVFSNSPDLIDYRGLKQEPFEELVQSAIDLLGRRSATSLTEHSQARSAAGFAENLLDRLDQAGESGLFRNIAIGTRFQSPEPIEGAIELRQENDR